MDYPLQGKVVLVTRPSHQAIRLCELIEQAGGEALSIPALEIVPLAPTENARQAFADLGSYDIAIFISTNAAEQAIALLGNKRFPESLMLAAIGHSTRLALLENGYHNIVSPKQRFDSEGLLTTQPFLDLAGKSILLIKGEGGREWLADTLVTKGAKLGIIELYRRILPEDSRQPLRLALAQAKINHVTITSNNGLENLMELAGDTLLPQLQELPMVVLSQRTLDFARAKGFSGPIMVADNAQDQAIVEALINLI